MTENGYEDNTAFLGEWGPFQQMVFFLLCLSIIPNGFTGMSIVFIGDTPSHHCLIPANANITGEWRNHSIPLEEESGTVVLSKCARYKLDVIKSFSERGYVPGIDVNVSEIQHETCLDGWEYDRGTYISTIVSEWDLVCADKWKNPLTSSVFFCGVLTGSFLSGQLSDRFGRKHVLFATMGVQTVFTFIQVFSPTWVVFCALFFVVGMGQISNYVAAFVLGTEILSPSKRIIYSTLGVCMFYTIGYTLLPAVAFFIRDWRMLMLALTLPGFLYVPFWWFIPESPRWLLSQGRVEEAEAILRDAARRNRVTAPEVIFQPVQLEPKAGKLVAHNICDLVRSSNIRWVSITLWLVWTILSIGYFALSLNTSNLAGSSYLNCFLSAAIEVPAYTMAWLMFRCCPRRLCLFSTLFLGGVVLLCINLIPPNLSSVSTALEMLGKFGVTAAFSIVYAYTAELYPTVVRNTAIGACSMASRVGSISAPYFIYLGGYSKSLPYILMGSLTALSGLLSLLLPESHRMPLPDTITHMQTFPGWKKRSVYKLSQSTGEEDVSDTL
ncbi:solute carrier family 22 member 5 isoform X1 [Oncorhynchus mykiss]|uniref:Major facilitator superfamily (MFS) profile domain-containing protein n=2 Tax=Oncorhynchus mykiss TaxID=8022 RepID=A0A8C7UBY9_ONCMY|nr:solute carrier family 22 member 5 isoform X1 [Oncorhynchus mykiss]